MNTKTEKPKFFGTKTANPIKKIAKTAKPKIPMPFSSFSQSNAVFATPNAILRSDIGMHCWNTAPFFFFNNMHGKNLKPTNPKRTSIFVSYRVCSLVSVLNYVSGLSSLEEWVFLRERYPPPAPDFPAPIKKRKKFINSRDLLVAFIS